MGDFRKGDCLVRKTRLRGIDMHHYALYTGDGIIHNTYYKSNIVEQRLSYDELRKQGYYRLGVDPCRGCFNQEEARSKIGEAIYHLFTNSCELFVNEFSRGRNHSTQMQHAFTGFFNQEEVARSKIREAIYHNLFTIICNPFVNEGWNHSTRIQHAANGEQVIENARLKKGKAEYNLLNNNCEHFVNDCRGCKHSTQIQHAFRNTVGVAFAIASIGIKSEALGIAFNLGGVSSPTISLTLFGCTMANFTSPLAFFACGGLGLFLLYLEFHKKPTSLLK